MSGISKRVSGSWVSGDYGIMKTATDTFATLPAVLYPNDTTATVGLKGNTVQTGTPTPDNPIMPQGTGERTGNLVEPFENYTWTPSNCIIVSNMNNQMLLDGNGYTGSSFSQAISTSKSIPLSLIGETVTFSGNITFQSEGKIAPRVTLAIERYGSSDYNISIYQGQYSYSFDMPNDATGYHFIVRIDQNRSEYVGTAKVTFSNIMLNLGSTALPYEPYGYKIPILSASTTTPVYLGEVQTTRKIKKYEFTGQETWSFNDATGVLYTFDISNFLATNGITCMCSHYLAQNNASGVAEVQNKHVCFRESTYNQFYLKDTDFNSTDALKSYLAAQYAAGTPVTVWYVLAEPTTGIVNEPIRKIGDYADTVSGITIPTTAGADSFDVLTTLKPSEVTVNYKGWHPVEDVHERESGAWT